MINSIFEKKGRHSSTSSKFSILTVAIQFLLTIRLRSARKTLYATVKIKNQDLGRFLNFFSKILFINHLRHNFDGEEGISVFKESEVAKKLHLSVFKIEAFLCRDAISIY